jgi:pyruvate phosphate dikinase-like enzyme
MQETLAFILPLADVSARLSQVGGKGASLAHMAAAGLPVPAGFHVTTAAYRRFVMEHELQEKILSAASAVAGSGSSWHCFWTWESIVPPPGARYEREAEELAFLLNLGAYSSSASTKRPRRKKKGNVMFRYCEKTALITGASSGIKTSSPVSI